MENHSYLNSLPIEFLRLIASFLPCASAIQFLSVSRKIQQACDDWTVWREIVKNDSEFPFETPRHANETRDIYKILAIASGITYKSRVHTNINQYPAQLIAYHHQAVSTIDPAALCLLSDPSTHEQESLPSFSIGSDGQCLAANPRIPYDISAIRAAQASSYCLAVRLLSPAAADEGVPYPWSSRQPLLHTVEWFKIASSRYHPRDDLQKLVAMLHTAANKVVGFFAAELRSALADKRVIRSETYGLAFPPTVIDIPFGSLMNSPPPVSPTENTFESFSPCHLPIMAHPDFFIESEWTGYFSHTRKRNVEDACDSNYVDYFDGIGGGNADVQANGAGQLCSSYPFLVERTVRFRFVHWMGDDVFLLQSNYFHSQTSTHSLEMQVHRRTGTIDVVHRTVGAQQAKHHAVITPFGVVEGCVPGGVWLWLWKVDWCAQS